MRSRLSLVVLACVCVLAMGAARADGPPIKPGLWQMKTERAEDGKPVGGGTMPSLDKLPPEARARVAEMMKQRGVELGAGDGTLKMCLTQASLDEGRWQGQHGQCTSKVTERSSARWKWHASCSKPVVESDGEATFESPERYTVRTQSQLTMNGQTRSTQMTIHAAWLGADCGTVKPFNGAP